MTPSEIRNAALYWMIVFEDQDRKPEVFTDEAAARKTLEIHLQHWDCRLFQEVRPTPPEPDSEDKALDALIVLAVSQMNPPLPYKAAEGVDLVAEVERLRKALEISECKNRNSLANNLCPDCRDKQAGKPCLACSNASMRKALIKARYVLEAAWTSNSDRRQALDGINEALKES